MYTFFVDLLKRGVFTLVGEIQRYRNYRYFFLFFIIIIIIIIIIIVD